MIRVLVQGTTLDDGEQHHLRVRRAEPGEVVELRDGLGLVGRGTLVRRGKDWAVEVVETDTAARPPELTLAVGAGDRDRFGWLVEKAAELGVTRVIPLETLRTAAVSSKLRGTHLERAQRRALEAIKQSGAAWAPVIEPSVSLDAWLADGMSGRCWLADAAGDASPAALDRMPVTVAIGPEGGFDPDERARLIARGFELVAFGSHTLRFETAAVAAAVAVSVARRRGAHD